jgi:2-desacetyl-2-hydroxyethyl bacteriochlorophyllide A dehydrogenase
MKAHTLFFTAPQRVEVRETELPALRAGEVLVETACSAISSGTEMLVYRGQFPDMDVDDCLPAFRARFAYPLAYGYACAGRVVAAGSADLADWIDRPVFAFQPHCSHFIASPGELLPIPDGLAPEPACFLPNMETAVNLVQDAAPILGERVLVLGQGVIGLLAVALLRGFPLERLVTADRYPLRRQASLALGANDSLDPLADDFRAAASGGFDLALELSGSPSALDDAIALTAFSGRVVIGSWYGQKRAPLDLGGTFHRSRIKLVSSQVSSIAPELSGRWDKPRRFAVAWDALERIRPEQWVSHRFPLEQAAEAYRLLDEKPGETIQVIFDHR